MFELQGPMNSGAFRPRDVTGSMSPKRFRNKGKKGQPSFGMRCGTGEPEGLTPAAMPDKRGGGRNPGVRGPEGFPTPENLTPAVMPSRPEPAQQQKAQRFKDVYTRKVRQAMSRDERKQAKREFRKERRQARREFRKQRRANR